MSEVLVNANSHEIKKAGMEKALGAVNRIKELNILEMIFKDFPDKRLIQKSHDLIGIMVRVKAIPEGFVDLVWSAYTSTLLYTLGNSGEISEAILGLIAEIALYGSQEVTSTLSIVN